MSPCTRTALALAAPLVLAVAAMCSSPATFAATAKPAAACVDATHHQFDFWLGDWDTFDMDASGKPPVARNHVDSILGGCVLREVYEQTDGLVGQSFTVYDVDRQLWHQSWVTNRGQLLVLEGRQEGRQIVLSGVERGDHDAMIRVSWEPQAGGVREIARKSHDGGKSWQPLFDILFRPHHH